MPRKYIYCNATGCQKRAYYNYPTLPPIYCIHHKQEGMSSRVHAICIHSGCTVIASFNYPDHKTLLYCEEHKLSEMINLKGLKCGYSNCKGYGTYCVVNYSGNDYRCIKHKTSQMINVKQLTKKQRYSRQYTRLASNTLEQILNDI